MGRGHDLVIAGAEPDLVVPVLVRPHRDREPQAVLRPGPLLTVRRQLLAEPGPWQRTDLVGRLPCTAAQPQVAGETNG